MQHGVQVYLVARGQVLQDMTPWIPLPGDIPKELALRAEEICQHYGVHRSNSDDLIKVPVCICMCMCKKYIIHIRRASGRRKQSYEMLLVNVSKETSKIPRL